MLAKLYSWYGRKTVIGLLLVVLVLIVVALVIKLKGPQTSEAIAELPVVETATVAELAGTEALSLLGTVEAIDEADIQSESAGRVTSVPVSLGQQITAGQIIATLENSQQRAAVLQAEGAYEAALASASVSNVTVDQAQTSLTSAKNNAVSTLQSSYNTVSNGFYSLIDDLYKDANSPLPSPYIVGDAGSYLRIERVAFQTILSDWQSEVSTLNTNSNLQTQIDVSISRTERARSLVDAFINALQNRTSETLNGTSVTVWIQNLSNLRSSLDASLISLQSAKTSLKSAEDSLIQAQIASTETELSTANAQVKQALGSLRAAEANLAKTILRSPISGTVNELDVKIGDFLGSFQSVAKVANNGGLQITVFLGENDLTKVNVGDRVTIDGIYDGTVTHIGAGIDRNTQKTEVKIATESTELTNGDTVSVALTSAETSTGVTDIILPIAAIKFTAEDGFVYTVEDTILVEHSIEVGVVRGGFVEVKSGVTPDMEIVIDARGLTAGSKVEASN